MLPTSSSSKILSVVSSTGWGRTTTFDSLMVSKPGGLLTAKPSMGSPLRLGGGVGVSVVVATLSASPSSESNKSAGGPSFKPQVGLEMVELDTTDCNGANEPLEPTVVLLETMVRYIKSAVLIVVTGVIRVLVGSISDVVTIPLDEIDGWIMVSTFLAVAVLRLFELVNTI